MRRQPLKELQRAYKLRAKARNIERARVAFQRAAESNDPEIAAEAYFQLAGMFEDQGDIEGASKAYGEALGSGVPGYGPNAGLLLGKMLLESGDLPGAQAAFERTIEYRDVPLREWPADPREPVSRDAVNWPFRAAVGLEVVLERLGDEEGAQRARRLSLELADTKEPARIDIRLGDEFRHYGYTAGAKNAYERAMSAEQTPASALAAHGLGGLLRDQGDHEGACAAYERAIALGDSEIADSARFHINQIRSP